MIEKLFSETTAILAGFRLQYLEVFNWGTFHKNIWRIEPGGYNSLLTGDIGSGKSTLVDALTSLLVQHGKITYNKAAGAEGKERSLASYVKGEYKKEKGEIATSAKQVFIRPEENTHSVILANFYNEGYQEHICLAQVFWLKSGKVEKLLIGSTRPLQIQEHFSHFSEISELKKRLRHIPEVELFDDNYSKYSEFFRHSLGMTSDKAVDLFYQTVSMKAVSSLTGFVREQMLEKTDVKEQIAVVLNRFDELNKAHDAVVHAREQYSHLKPLVEFAVEYGELSAQIEAIEQMLTVIPGWFAEKKLNLYESTISETERTLELANLTLQAITEEGKLLDKKRIGLMQDIANNGGKRLEQIAAEIDRRTSLKEAKRKDWDSYGLLAQRGGLKPIENQADFDRNLQEAGKIFTDCESKEADLRAQRDKIVISLVEKENEQEDEQHELTSLKNRISQIPGWLIEIRNRICTDLRIEDDTLLFAGELLRVDEHESVWEGAIERLLHDFGMRLLVPPEHYRSVSNYINANIIRTTDGKGRKITYLSADTKRRDNNAPKRLTEDSVVHKLLIKPDNPFEEWMEGYLNRKFGDYACVDVEELQQIPYGLTQEGTIRNGWDQHTKDDRSNITDKRNFVLGWSNVEKIKALEESLQSRQIDIQRLKTEKNRIEAEETRNANVKTLVGRLRDLTDYSVINWQLEVEKIRDLEKEQRELLDNNDLLNRLKHNLDEVEVQLADNKSNESAKNQEIGGINNSLEGLKKQLGSCQQAIGALDLVKKEQHYPAIEQLMEGKQVKLSNADQLQDQLRRQFEGDTGELKKMRFNLTRLATNMTRKMRDIKEHSKAEYSELSEDVEARGEYIEKFNRLVQEDLKRHEERFKEQLNRNVINSIAVFDTQLEKHEKDIKQKIVYINQHLQEIVYDASKDTYISILIDQSDLKDIRQFREDLRLCYVNTLGDESGLYNEAKYEQVKKILDRFASMDNIDKEWTSTVTDVRNWFEFNAIERYRADETEKEFYEGSGGKSGGQKEKLAYTILASALAYQFGLQFGEEKSRSFRFVVIDEAFGRGSDESTRYGLELFRKLNLQLLIVTPLQKIHIIENHVNAFHFVSNRDGNNSQILNLTAAEYKSGRDKRNSELI